VYTLLSDLSGLVTYSHCYATNVVEPFCRLAVCGFPRLSAAFGTKNVLVVDETVCGYFSGHIGSKLRVKGSPLPPSKSFANGHSRSVRSAVQHRYSSSQSNDYRNPPFLSVNDGRRNVKLLFARRCVVKTIHAHVHVLRWIFSSDFLLSVVYKRRTRTTSTNADRDAGDSTAEDCLMVLSGLLAWSIQSDRLADNHVPWLSSSWWTQMGGSSSGWT